MTGGSTESSCKQTHLKMYKMKTPRLVRAMDHRVKAWQPRGMPDSVKGEEGHMRMMTARDRVRYGM